MDTLWADICQPTAGLTSTCPQTEVKKSSSRFKGDVWSTHRDARLFGVLDRNYHHKSVVTQVSQYARLAHCPLDWPKIPRPPEIEPVPHPIVRYAF